ncbi:MAG: class I SAM-dependent rRNA methyltransferase [Planctomycetaceae bacterium]|nr:class I SAM-dependent rRNA methyltransferase [Planctomycetaceae bacterium]
MSDAQPKAGNELPSAPSLPTEFNIPATLPVAYLQPRRAQPFFGRHPWVFPGAIRGFEDGAGSPVSEDSILPGTPVRLLTSEGKFIATGLHNNNSRIRLRLYTWNEAEMLAGDFWKQKIETAIAARRDHFDLASDRTGCRLVFSESDQLSGLTVDWYAGFALVQFTSLALYQHRKLIIDALQSCTDPRGIWLRTEKGMREAEGLEAVDGLIAGQEPPRPLFIEEHGVQYGVDVQQGQKTGCFLDQRDNRLAVSRFTRNAKVLDAFCFSGGFGITALKCGGAANVLGIDSSDAAITLAAANAELNGVAGHCRWMKADVKNALEELAGQGTTFDVVILDPPRMARTRGGIERALNGYLRLNMQGMQVLKPGGILVTCSCSGLVAREEFREMLAEASRQSRRAVQILETHGQPMDHPVMPTCPETEYLKVFICRVL